ncbi:WhiB family transcriptional regulator [Nonomuraea sp. LPB2021202275-12-8]|uniref:WhiB family transcriptional regulator n=1 Tax=Nonomuraea sp. LPB2021202275-12-8 TaxID=3120159 RepID=UPI00300CED35
MNTHEFEDATPPEILYRALEPYAPPAGAAACATHNPARFDTPRRQDLAFWGEPLDPAVDYPAAREICLACPLLAACRKYADDSREEQHFLAGMTAAELVSRRTKRTEIAKRRRQVQELHALGASTTVIADILGRDPSLIRGDLRSFAQQDQAAM